MLDAVRSRDQEHSQKILHPQKFVAAVICKLFSFWLVIWLKSLAFCKHAIVTFCVEPCAL